MHVSSISLAPERYPVRDQFPFNLPIFAQPLELCFRSPVTFFVGENGSGKSTLLRAICRRCGIYIWEGSEPRLTGGSPYAEALHRAVDLSWTEEPVPGAFFGSDSFRHFSLVVERWAQDDPGQLEFFGGRSLLAQSHGEAIMAFFRNRLTVPGIYFLDEPETALSPRTQLQLLALLENLRHGGLAQFVIATHSPILMACTDARLYSFDGTTPAPVRYQDTDHFRVYAEFLDERRRAASGPAADTDAGGDDGPARRPC